MVVDNPESSFGEGAATTLEAVEAQRVSMVFLNRSNKTQMEL
jgi:hypothetical protein